MADEYDVIVVGGGAAGENVAGRCAAGGLRTVLVERDLVGGECSYWSCMPSKALLRPGEALAEVRRVPGAREAVTGELDPAAALARRDEVVSEWDDRHQVEWVAEAGVELLRGHARLAGIRKVTVDTEEGRRKLTATRAVVVATGSSAAAVPIRGLDVTRVWDNRDAAEAKEIPERLIVVGGGPVGCELAQAFRRLGSRKVTVVEATPTLLPREEPFAGAQVRAALMAEGIMVFLNNTVHRVHRDGDDGPITALVTSGQTITADELLLAVGRWPNTADLGLETVGLRPGEPVTVDDRLLATGVDGEWLYAVGDVNERALYTHMGKYQARVAAERILGRDLDASAGHRAVPRIVFTEPQVAAVGLTEHGAAQAGIEARVVACSLESVAAATLRGVTTAGTCQLLVDRHREVLLGATFTGPGVAELLQAATFAIVGEIPLATLRHAVPAFPTVGEVWLKLIEGYFGAVA